RDRNVTGVQTCALPISRNSTTAARPSPSLPRRRRRSNGLWPGRNRSLSYISAQMQQVLVLNASYEPLNVTTVRRAHVLVYKGKRSEERRVGKECRCVRG